MAAEQPKAKDAFTIPSEDGVWVALLKKCMFMLSAVTGLLMLVAIAVGSSYKEDRSRIPVYKMNLLIDEEKLNFDDVTSPLDVENRREDVKPLLDRADRNKAPDEAEKAINLVDNDFSTLNRKMLNVKALNIIDPLPQMTMASFGNRIPIISKNGDIPWKVYAKPFNNKNKKNTKISVIITSLGLDEELSSKIIDAFPEEVSVSFSPYTKDLKKLARMARMKGKETYIDLPFEIKTGGDPGPFGIMKNLNEAENISRYIKAIGQDISFCGIINSMGEQSAIPEIRTRKVISMNNQHGLLYIGNEKPFPNDLVLNYNEVLFSDLNRSSLKKRFDDFLKKSLEQKYGIILVDAKPSALVATLKFLDTLIDRKDIVLAPPSALMKERIEDNVP